MFGEIMISFEWVMEEKLLSRDFWHWNELTHSWIHNVQHENLWYKRVKEVLKGGETRVDVTSGGMFAVAFVTSILISFLFVYHSFVCVWIFISMQIKVLRNCTCLSMEARIDKGGNLSRDEESSIKAFSSIQAKRKTFCSRNIENIKIFVFESEIGNKYETLTKVWVLPVVCPDTKTKIC